MPPEEREEERREEPLLDPEGAEAAEARDIPLPGENPDEEVIPTNPARRMMAMITALVFIAVIVTFLVLFIAGNTEQSEPGSVLGQAIVTWRECLQA